MSGLDADAAARLHALVEGSTKDELKALLAALTPPTFEDEAMWMWEEYLRDTLDPEPYTLDEFTEANYRTIVETMMENDW